MMNLGKGERGKEEHDVKLTSDLCGKRGKRNNYSGLVVEWRGGSSEARKLISETWKRERERRSSVAVS